jgi:hypothetical protein
MDIIPAIGDASSRVLAGRLRHRAREVTEPQRSRLLGLMPNTLFISHTSADDPFIKGENNFIGQPGSIWWIIGTHFPDPFYHSCRSGAAESYERLVGCALLASTRVLVVWSPNALRSNYVRAEILIASEDAKRIAAYIAPNAPDFPIAGVTLIYDCDALVHVLDSWKRA